MALLLHHLQVAEERGLATPRAVQERGLDEALEERMRLHRARLELRMELARDEPRMPGQLDHLDQRAVRREAGQHEAAGLELLAVRVVELVPVTVALGGLAPVVDLPCERALGEHAGIAPEAHRAALLREPAL